MRILSLLLIIITNTAFSMQLTVKEEDIPRTRRLTESGLSKITQDYCPMTHTKFEKLHDKFFSKVENLKSSNNLEAQEAMEKLKKVARAYAASNNIEAVKEIEKDKDIMNYINSMVVQSMDEYLHEKDMTIEDLTQKQEREKLEKYLAFGCSAVCTFIGIVGPIILGSIMCGG